MESTRDETVEDPEENSNTTEISLPVTLPEEESRARNVSLEPIDINSTAQQYKDIDTNGEKEEPQPLSPAPFIESTDDGGERMVLPNQDGHSEVIGMTLPRLEDDASPKLTYEKRTKRQDVPLPEEFVFNITIEQVWKVFQTGSLDYWTYGILVTTNLPSFGAVDNNNSITSPTEGSNQMITINTGRRYKEFVWLRNALVQEYPGNIVPPLPGLTLEGILEKVDAYLVAATGNEVPVLVSYRMRSLDLFLKWLVECPTLRDSFIFRTFLESSPDELTTFISQWKPTLQLPQLGVKGWWIKVKCITGHTPKALHSTVEFAKLMTSRQQGELTALRNRLEQVWDSIVVAREPYLLSTQFPKKEPDPDMTINAIQEVAEQIYHAAYAFNGTNENRFLSLVVKITFLQGLSTVISQSATHIEELNNLEVQMASSGMSETSDFLRLLDVIDRSTQSFESDFNRITQKRQDLLKNSLLEYCILASHIDTTYYPFEEHCKTAIDSLRDWVVPLPEDKNDTSL